MCTGYPLLTPPLNSSLQILKAAAALLQLQPVVLAWHSSILYSLGSVG